MMLNLFKKPKKTLTVGIQLSTTYISLLVLDWEDSESPKIKEYLNYPVDEQTDAKALKETIKAYINNNGLKKAPCCLVLDDQDYHLLAVEPPKVPAEEMAEAIKWKVKDLIHFPITEAVVDVFSLPETAGQSVNIANAVVAHKEIIEKKSAFINDIDLSLMAIDIPEFSYRNYFETKQQEGLNIALVLVKASYGKLMVINKSNVCFSRSFSVSYNGGLFDDIPENEIVLELQRSLDYYERQMKQIMPSQVVFIGENIIEEKIGETTTESFNQKVSVETIDGFGFSEEDQAATARVIASYGASLRHGLINGLTQGA